MNQNQINRLYKVAKGRVIVPPNELEVMAKDKAQERAEIKAKANKPPPILNWGNREEENSDKFTIGSTSDIKNEDNIEIRPVTDDRSKLDQEIYGPSPTDSIRLTIGAQAIQPDGLSFAPGIEQAEANRIAEANRREANRIAEANRREANRIAEANRQKESDDYVAKDNKDIQNGIAWSAATDKAKAVAAAAAAKAKVNNTSPLLSGLSSLSSVQKALLGLGVAGAGYGLYQYLNKKKKKRVIYENELEYNT